MSTYYTTYPQTVSFLSMSEAFQASENWIPTLSLSLEVLDIQSKETEQLRAEYAVLDEDIQLAYDYLCQQINDVMLWWQRDGVTLNPDLLQFIQNTYLSRDLFPSFGNSHFAILTPNLHPDTVITGLDLAVVRPDWVEDIREERQMSSSTDNLFSGLGTALFSLYVNSNLEGQAFEDQMELNKQLILQFQERTFDRTARRGELSDAIRSLNQNINLEVSSALQTLVADYITLSLPWQPPAEDETMFNVKAKVTTSFTKPSRAEAVYEVISIELRDVRDQILQQLQDLFPQYVIPLTTAPPSYNPTNQPTQPNLRLRQNGTADRYPVRDKLSGRGLMVGGDTAYFGFDRYGGNGSAVPSMEEFIRYIFPEVQVVSEYDVEYQLSGRDDFDDYLADLEACTEEGDLEALADQYNVYCDSSEVSEHIAVLSTLPVDDLNRPIMVNSIPLEEVYSRAEAYDTAVRELTETFNTQRGETLSMESEQSRPFFNPEDGEPYDLSDSPSGSEVSYAESLDDMKIKYGNRDRIFFIKSVDYDTDGEIENDELPQEFTIKIPSNYHYFDEDADEGDITDVLNEWISTETGFSTKGIVWIEEENNSWRKSAESYEAESKPRLSKKQLESLNMMKMSYYHRNNDSAYVEVDNRGHKPFKSRPVQGLLNKGIISIPRADNPGFWGDVGRDGYGAYTVYLNPVAWEYPFTYPYPSGSTGYQTLRQVRQEGTEMVLDAEQKGDIWDYLVVEERPETRKKVRTMTGKPHTPRKLIKDKAITPEEAAKRKQIRAENKKDETVVDKTEESGITTETRQYKKKKYNPDKMKTDIPANVLNQTDSDDNWVILFSGLLGAGVAAMITNWAWVKRVQGD